MDNQAGLLGAAAAADGRQGCIESRVEVSQENEVRGRFIFGWSCSLPFLTGPAGGASAASDASTVSVRSGL